MWKRAACLKNKLEFKYFFNPFHSPSPHLAMHLLTLLLILWSGKLPVLMVIRGNMEEVWFAGGMNCQVLGRLSLDIIFHHCKQNTNSFPVVSRRTEREKRDQREREERREGRKFLFLIIPSVPLDLVNINRDFKIQWRHRNENVKKTIDFKSKTTTLHEHHTFFLHLFSRFSTTTTWKCLISRFMENVNKQRRNAFSLSELGYGP